MPAPATPIRLVAGLGNPGREYEGTRHNAGFLVLDRLAVRMGLDLKFSAAWQTLWSRSRRRLSLLEAHDVHERQWTGGARLRRVYKVDAAEMLIVYDDLALPLGQLRLRKNGSSGGQNGMESVIEHLGTTEVPRLRVGIGAAGRERSMVDHVLGTFTPAEREALDGAIDRAADAVEHARRHGVEAAMNLF